MQISPFCFVRGNVLRRPHLGLAIICALAAAGASLLGAGRRLDVGPAPIKISAAGVVRYNGNVNGIAVSRDGKQVLVGTDDGTATLTDLETRQTLARVERGKGVYSVALSGDGKLALIGTSGADFRADFTDGAAILWSLEHKRQIGGPLSHGGRVSGVCFSPDGSLAVTASFDGSAKVWEVRTGRMIGEALRHKNPIQDVAFSPDGKVIATASWDKTVRLWDANSFKAIGAPLQHRDCVWCVAFSPNGEKIVTGSGDPVVSRKHGEVVVWDRDGAKVLSHQQNGLVSAVTFSATGEYIFAGVGNELRAWRSADGEAPVVSLSQDGRIHAVGVSADGKYVLFGGTNKSLFLGRIEE